MPPRRYARYRRRSVSRSESAKDGRCGGRKTDRIILRKRPCFGYRKHGLFSIAIRKYALCNMIKWLYVLTSSLENIREIAGGRDRFSASCKVAGVADDLRPELGDIAAAFFRPQDGHGSGRQIEAVEQ